jgi:hypothetical protein
MTVQQLREALQAMPGHWPVHVKVRGNEFDGEDWDWLFTLDCVPDSFPTQGCMATITINYEPK